MILKTLTDCIEEKAPLSLQESYDNSGLIIGSHDMEIHKALVTMDVTEKVMKEAIKKGCKLIISHHPLIFGNIKKINSKNVTEKLIISAIKNDIAIYAAHTNFDNISHGVNEILGKKLGLSNLKILQPKENLLKKLITFCPVKHVTKVQAALFSAGAGHIGNYDCCSYNTSGEGTFRALENANPFVGKPHEIHHEKEVKIEVIFPAYKQSSLIHALISAHPYEEVAYDIFPLHNSFNQVGSGMMGYVEKPKTEKEFLDHLKKSLDIKAIRHSPLLNKKIKTVAFCGGSGSFLIKEALAANVDAFITADLKYHNFFEPENRFLLADIGHYESEQFTKELIVDCIKKKFPKFAILNSEVNTNPVNYY
jgi:dinuclear metal center YbgI/SA1388 family protein